MATPGKHHHKAHTVQQQPTQQTVQPQREHVSNGMLAAGFCIDILFFAVLWFVGKRHNWLVGVTGFLFVMLGAWVASQGTSAALGGAVIGLFGIFLAFIAFVRWVAAAFGRAVGRGVAQAHGPQAH